MMIQLLIIISFYFFLILTIFICVSLKYSADLHKNTINNNDNNYELECTIVINPDDNICLAL